jgi:hypothetical protein
MDDSTKFADLATELLERGHSVRFQAPGRSMHPTIREGETITVEPVEPSAVKRGDIILYRSESGVIAHRVICIEKQEMLGDSAQFPIAFDDTRSQQDHLSSEEALKGAKAILDPCFEQGDPQGPKERSSSSESPALGPQHLFLLRGDASVNRDYPVKVKQILGKVVSVERGGRPIDLYSLQAKVEHMAHSSALRFKRLLKGTFLIERSL